MIRLSFLPARQLRTATLSGVVTEEEIREVLGNLPADPASKVSDLIDTAELLRLELSPEGAQELLAIVDRLARSGEATGARLAIVAPDRSVSGVAELCADVVEGRVPGRPIALFRTRFEAIAWLAGEHSGRSSANPSEPRVNANFPVLYTVAGSDYAGTIVNISRSGALVATDQHVPGVGIQLRPVLFAGSRQIELEARVVRHIERGFAVEFLGVPVELLELLADLGG